MYTLYSRPGTGGFVVEAALAMAGAPVTLVNVPQGESDADFLAISPLGQVPALRLPEGGTMTESAAMAILIGERYPESGIAPPPGSPDRPDFLRWMAFFATVIYPATLRYFYADRYTSDAAGIEGVRAAAVAEIDRAFLVVDRWLEGRDWMVGASPTIADVYLLMLAHWHPVGDRPRPEWTNVVRCTATTSILPVPVELNRVHRMW